MHIIIKPSCIKNIKEYLKEERAYALSFGLEGLTAFDNAISLYELKKIKQEYPNKKIYLSIDKNFFNNEIEKLKETLQEIETLNIEGIFFYDLAVLNIHKNLNLKTPLIWNQNFLTTNYKTCNYYYEKGVKKVLLSSEITIDEIKEIANNTKSELFVNIFGYQLMSLSKRKLITNYLKYTGYKKQETNYLKKEGKEYLIKENEYGTSIYTNHILNGITKINELKKINANIILDEMNIEKETFKKVLKLYEESLNDDISLEELNKKEEKIKKLLSNTSLGFFDLKTIYKVKK